MQQGTLLFMYILKKFMTLLMSNVRQSNQDYDTSFRLYARIWNSRRKMCEIRLLPKVILGEKTTLILTKCPILDIHLDLSPARVSCSCKTSSSSLCGSMTSVDRSSNISEFSSADLSRFVLWHPLTASISIPSTGKGVWRATYYV